MSFIYLPSLKAKAGELLALHDLDENTRTKLCPILEIPDIGWDYAKDEPAKTLEQHLNDVITTIKQNWTSIFFVDFSNNLQVQAIETLEGNGDLLSVFDELAKGKNLHYIPVVSFDPNTITTFRESSKTINDRDKSGICLRVKFSDTDDLIEPSKYEELFVSLGIPASEIDLILDFGSINSYESDKTLYLATRLVLSSIPRLIEWRSVSVIASSFPLSLSGIPKNSTKKMRRVEWLSWLRLYGKRGKIGRLPTFGDYSISHPDFIEIDPRVMNMSASIRYSSKEEWVILKGESVKLSGFKQFPALSKQLVSLEEYSGETFSAGDGQIFKYANGPDNKTGNATTWRNIGNNHHFCLVINQISNLFSP